MKMSELRAGQSGRIEAVGGEGALRQHFLDMGVIPGAEATMVKLAPMGDPMELRLHGYELTLRLADGRRLSHRGSLCIRLHGLPRDPLPGGGMDAVRLLSL